MNDIEYGSHAFIQIILPMSEPGGIKIVMKKNILALFLLFLTTISSYSRDFTFTYEGQTVSYTVIDENSKTCMTKEWYGGDKYYNKKPGNRIFGNLVLPEHPIDEGVEYSLISIGEGSFYENDGLISVEIPNSVTTFPSYAFGECKSLKSVILPNSISSLSDYSFKNCQSLTSVSIPNSVTTIGEATFSGCSSLNNLELPTSIKSLDHDAFYGCSALTTITIPESVTSISDDLFSHCSSLITVNIPNSVKSIGSGAFGDCISLEAIDIPNSVDTIGSWAFSGCKGLTSLDIPNSVTSIERYAFARCSGLTSVIIPNSVTSMGIKVFNECDNLKKCAYPNKVGNPFGENVVSIVYPSEGSVIEDGWVWGPGKNAIYFVPTTVEGDCTIPESVLTIGENAFWGCNQISTINLQSMKAPKFYNSSFDNETYEKVLLRIPEGTIFSYYNNEWIYFKKIIENGSDKNIEVFNYNDGVFNYVYFSCSNDAILTQGKYSNMTNVSIPNRIAIENGEDATFYNVAQIGNNAFNGCSNIKTIKLSKNIVRIGDYAFNGCSNITTVAFPELLAEIGFSAFRKSGLKTAVFPEPLSHIGEAAFQECANLASVVFNQNVKNLNIGNSAFEHTAITKISFPPSTSIIGDLAFADCSKLSTLTIDENVKDLMIGNAAFSSTNIKSILIPNGVNFLGQNVFSNCLKLNSVSIGEGITEIPLKAFYNCTNLLEIKLGKKVNIIGSSAFEGTTSLKYIDFPSSVSMINYGAFKNSGLTELFVPSSVKVIATNAFYNCQYLSSLTIEDGFEQIRLGSYWINRTHIKKMHIGRNFVTDGISYVSDLFSYLDITDLSFGNTVTIIPDKSFLHCSNINNLQLGASVESIGESAFQDNSIVDLVIPPSVKRIGAQAFASNKIKTLSIGCGILEIGEKAFDANNNIENLYMTAVTPPNANNNTFSRYEMPLWLIDNMAFDNYSNYPRCWYRFEDNMFPLVAIENIKTDVKELKVFPGDSIKLAVSIEPINVTLPQIFWHSTLPSLMTVDSDGTVHVKDNVDCGYLTRSNEVECKIIASTMYGDTLEFTFNLDVNESGIKLIENDSEDINMNNNILDNNIYNIQGICIKRNATQEEIDDLLPGIYIIGGKKILIR